MVAEVVVDTEMPDLSGEQVAQDRPIRYGMPPMARVRGVVAQVRGIIIRVQLVALQVCTVVVAAG